MRRQLILVLVILLSTVALISAYDQVAKPGSVAAMPVATLQSADGAIEVLKLEPIEPPYGPSVTTANPATNSCSAAPSLGINDGFATKEIESFNHLVDGSDPQLSCLWGDPHDARGLRTAWYSFEPDAYGLVSISTWSSDYDTVLAVHKGTCDVLIEVACNDDDNYFSSELTLQVQAGETYFVEVADWHSAASGSMTLNLETISQPIESQWQITSAGSALDSFRSRHAVVADGTKLYVIAGQTRVGSAAERTPTMYVYDTALDTTERLANMPGGSDQLGYSNTTAALVAGQIYMPAGFTGLNDGTHWVYNIAANAWDEDAAVDNNWATAQPAIYSQATTYHFSGPPGSGYFLSGGMTGTFPVSDSSGGWAPRPELSFYSVDSKSWISLNAMSTARFGHVAALQMINGGEHLCVAGGMGGTPGSNREALSSTSCFNINLGTWSEFAPLNYERYFASSGVDAQGNWFVVGGYDNADKTVGITERYDPVANKWIVLGPEYSVVPTRAWSRGAYVDNAFWIIGGELENQDVLNMVQRALLFRGTTFNYLPVIVGGSETDRRNDTFATAREVRSHESVFDRFYTPRDIVNMYGFDVPSRQPVRIRLNHLHTGNYLDMVVYTENKGFQAASRQPGRNTEDITLELNPGRYFVAVERDFPQVGLDPLPGDYLLEVFLGG